jgi:hypothetical protein
VDDITLPGTGEIVAADDVGGLGVKYQIVKLADGTNDGSGRIGGDATNGLDVDVTRVIPGTAATNLGKAEDAAHADGDTGVLLLGVRGYGGASTDGDYSALSVNAAGNLNVSVAAVVPGTGATNLGKAEDAVHADGDTGVLLLGVRNYGGAGADGDYSALSVSSSGEQYVIGRKDQQRIAVTSAGLTTATTSYTAGDQVGTQFTFANAARVTGGSGVITGVSLVSAQDAIGPMDLIVSRSSMTLAADNAAYAISDADALNVLWLIPLQGAWDIGNNRLCQAMNLALPYDCSGTSLFGGLITRAGHTFFGAVTDLQLTLWVERN